MYSFKSRLWESTSIKLPSVKIFYKAKDLESLT